MIPTTNPPSPPFAKGGKQNHDTATDLPVLTCTPLCKRGAGGDFQRGISLIELIMFIVIVSVALAGILLVMNQVVGRSADPLIRKQAMAVAESMLEEIRLQDLSGGGLCTGTLGADAARSNADSVCDYNGYSTTAGIRDFSTNGLVQGLQGYNISSVNIVTPIVLGGIPIPAASGVMITVTVADPTGATIDATGYRAGN